MISALILAGGRARRMGGIDKRELVVEGQTIFERQCAVLADRVTEIIVSSPRPIAGFRTVTDPIEGGGPVAGIAAGLAAARTPWLLVIAGDMPRVSGALIDRMIDRMIDRSRAPNDRPLDAVGVRIDALPEPLFVLYRVAAVREVAEARLAARQLKASELLTDAGLAVAWIEEAELRELDPTLKLLSNINEPCDL